MSHLDSLTTNRVLLGRLGDWQDHEAWGDFVVLYDPLIRLYTRRFRLTAETSDDLCQRIWIDLARRMRTYQYDPARTFRGWLRRLCQSRAIDFLREKHERPMEWTEDQAERFSYESSEDFEDDDGSTEERSRLLRQAEVIQAAVRRRVDDRTWRVFWEIAVEGHSVRETSTAVGMSYYAAFAAQKRVGKMLLEEAQRFLSEPLNQTQA